MRVDEVTALSDFINLYLLPGLVVGCIYALGAIGISLLVALATLATFIGLTFFDVLYR